MNIRQSFRFGLAHCLALIALVAVWAAVYKLRSDSDRMRSELESYQEFFPVLLVDDLAKLTVLEEPQEWNHKIAWQVYIPQSHPYSLVAKQISLDSEPLDSPELRVPLAPGRHRVLLNHAIPMMLQTGVVAYEDVYLSVDEEKMTLSHHEYPVAGRSFQLPRKNSNGQRYEEAPDTTLQILAGGVDFPWSLSLVPEVK